MTVPLSPAAPAPQPHCRECDRTHRQPTRPLSPREQQIARLLAQGKSRGEIANALTISPRTVQEHIRRIAVKLPSGGLTPRDAVLVWAYWEYRAGGGAA